MYFDLGPPLAFNDDWVYAWSARHLALGHGLRAGPEQAESAILQPLLGVAFSLGHPDQRLLRLSVLPLTLVAVVCVFGIARRLGADATWSWVAGAAALTAPLFLSFSTTFMTDVPVTALVLATALAAGVWLDAGRLAPMVVALAILTTLERQTGIAAAPALSVGLWLTSRQRRVSTAEWAWLVVLWVGVAAALALPLFLTAGGTQRAVFQHLGNEGFRIVGGPLAGMPGVVGLLSIPFFGALRPRLGPPRRRREVALFGFACVLLIVVFAWALPASILPGPYFSANGLGPLHVSAGVKSAWLPGPVFAVLELVVELAFVAAVGAVVTALRRRDHVALLATFAVLGLGQLIPAAHFGSFDRYYPTLAFLVLPVCAAEASRRAPARGLRWALVAMSAGVLLYIGGEQDYQAWSGARDDAARLAYRYYRPAQVDAGYEANGVYVVIPLYDAGGGSFPGPQVYLPIQSLAMRGPTHPCVRLAFATSSDNRLGVSYTSMAPGRIIIVPVYAGVAGSGCPSFPRVPGRTPQSP